MDQPFDFHLKMTVFETFLKCGSVSTDTRTIAPGALFFALKGGSFNGNVFAKQALDLGAAFAVVDEVYEPDERFIVVPDALRALQECATAYREYLDIPIIALTGSNGKTTNKELFHAVLAMKYRVHATAGNFNNHIGVPLTLLAIPAAAEMAVVEMGANHQGEIAHLSEICRPNLGYITNFGKAHLEGFGGVEGVIKGKSELYNYLKSQPTAAFLVNADDPIQVEKTDGVKELIAFGKEGAEYQWESLNDGPMAAIKFKAPGQPELEIHSQLSGKFHEINIAAAATLGTYWEVDGADIKHAIEHYRPNMNRSEWRNTGRNEVLLDAYNANPTSMALSIENFITWHPNGLLVLGDMFELGTESRKEHQAIVDLIDNQFSGDVILVGKHFSEVAGSYLCFADAQELLNYWNEKGAPKGAHILLKGSRGIALEQLLSAL